ncbi:methionine gamma-lyase family protein [Thermodesulfitimonas autotrophica]|uniref:methionine gamma-lyase family protein n=1 Tax=Thermodesulfitimonas autotrophica TaxID=1894989 RepID=UPI000F4D5D8C|nr:methionine gamma-lyase family protein [Thermodesulfitimonas autotrophica]
MVRDLKLLAAETLEAVKSLWCRIDNLALENQRRVLAAYHAARVSDFHLRGSTGYGYGDAGREALEAVYAAVFGGAAALVRPQIVSGTHALSLCLYGVLRPGDELVSVQGKPYDTLEKVISGAPGALAEWGVRYTQVEPLPDGSVDEGAVARALARRPRAVLLQRSGGYSWRRGLRLQQIGALVKLVKEISPATVVIVDNCYGEFVEEAEPPAVGADLCAGSLIKNPGGGIAPTGGYVVGREELVELAASRLTAPGLGRSVGPTLDCQRLFLQGFFLAPHFVAEALKGAVFAAHFFARLGFEVLPRFDEPRSDIVQGIRLGSPEKLLAFCRAIQATSPVDAHVRPEGGPLPGYQDAVVMAAGTFIQGASLEFTADAPVREPYAVYLQGGLSKEHVILGVIAAAEAVLDDGFPSTGDHPLFPL